MGLDHSATLAHHVHSCKDVHRDKTVFYSSSARQSAGNRMQEYGETDKRWLPLISRVWVRYVAARWTISICNDESGSLAKVNLINLAAGKQG